MADAAGLEGAGRLEGFEFEVDVTTKRQLGDRANLGGWEGREVVPACFEGERGGSNEGCLHPWLLRLFANGTHFCFCLVLDQLTLGNRMG